MVIILSKQFKFILSWIYLRVCKNIRSALSATLSGWDSSKPISILMTLDTKKAFYKVYWHYIFSTLQHWIVSLVFLIILLNTNAHWYMKKIPPHLKIFHGTHQGYPLLFSLDLSYITLTMLYVLKGFKWDIANWEY